MDLPNRMELVLQNALNDGEMLGMMYYVKGIISKIPSG